MTNVNVVGRCTAEFHVPFETAEARILGIHRLGMLEDEVWERKKKQMEKNEGAARRRGRVRERGKKVEPKRTTKTWKSKEGQRMGPPENYKLYVVPNRPSEIIPAHPPAIMNM